MSAREHAESNYRRISLINWFLSVPLLILFGWPYAYLVTFVGLPRWLAYGGGFVFALPMIMTLIHGHVTMALGYAQRDYYYRWLLKNRRTHGLFFHPAFVRTRFRLGLIYASGALLIGSWLVKKGFLG